MYRELYDKGLQLSSIKQVHILLNACLKLAVEDDLIRKNPSNGCAKMLTCEPTEKIALTKEQQRIFLDFVQHDSVYSKNRPMIIFMLETGIRCGELTGLTWNDIDFTNKILNVNHQFVYRKVNGKFKLYASNPKTSSGVRKIPLTAIAIAALQEQRKMQFSKGHRSEIEIDGYSDFVFTTRNNKPIIQNTVNSMLRFLSAKINKTNPDINFPHITPHTLRHTACTRMAEAGMNVKVIQKIMGHRNISITMNIYNHATQELISEEMEKFDISRNVC